MMSDKVKPEGCPHRYDLMDGDYAWCDKRAGHPGNHLGGAIFFGKDLKQQFYWEQGDKHDYTV